MNVATPDPAVRRWPSLIFLVLLVAMLGGCGSSSNSLPPALPTNPLSPCPETPNCERVSRGYPAAPDTLYDATREGLTALGPRQLSLHPDSLTASAVYRVAWVFTDDVDIAVEPQEHGSVLHVRSASRVGVTDFGVNRRRVRRLLSEVNRALE